MQQPPHYQANILQQPPIMLVCNTGAGIVLFILLELCMLIWFGMNVFAAWMTTEGSLLPLIVVTLGLHGLAMYGYIHFHHRCQSGLGWLAGLGGLAVSVAVFRQMAAMRRPRQLADMVRTAAKESMNAALNTDGVEVRKMTTLAQHGIIM